MSLQPWGRGSSDSFEKSGSSGDKSKEDKRRKDKKPGMLSGLFKRKDRKSKAVDDDGEEPEKVSEESARSSTPPKTSSESLKDEIRTPKPPQPAPQRHPSKLQKTPPPELSSVKETETETETGRDSPQSPPVEEDPKSSLRLVPSDSQPVTAPQPLQVHSSKTGEPSSAAQYAAGREEDVLSEVPLKFATDASQSSPVDRSQADDFESSSDSRKPPEQPRSPDEQTAAVPAPLASQARSEANAEAWPAPGDGQAAEDRKLPAKDTQQQPSRQIHSAASSEHPTIHEPPPSAEERTQRLTPTTHHDPAWSDANLRSYLEDGSEIRDLLVIIHDKSNVPPTGADHPVTGSLYKEESKALGEMSSRLDDMLNSWLSQRSLTYIR